ncbi:hypothetical protein ABZ896_02510 [Streptomyces sp. NPDC047072]|uniref:hypothetical protein n=1 Tax=Streptomyces sp. NPDC047072 TaxID=3154809 RepID=UPI0033CB1DD1
MAEETNGEPGGGTAKGMDGEPDDGAADKPNSEPGGGTADEPDGEAIGEAAAADGTPDTPPPASPWDAVAETILLELVGLALAGVVALIGWPFGWFPDPALITFMMTTVALGHTIEVYRTGPPSRLAALIAFLVLVTVALLVTAAVNAFFPSLTDSGVGLLVGTLVGFPAGVATLARVSARPRSRWRGRRGPGPGLPR